MVAGVAEQHATCHACGQAIIWLIADTSEDGVLRIPVDPGHHPDGTIVRVTQPGRIRARVLGGHELPAQEPAHLDHRRSCPRGKHAARRAHIAAAKCGTCRERMDPWLVEHGYTAHIGCLPTTPDVRRPA